MGLPSRPEKRRDAAAGRDPIGCVARTRALRYIPRAPPPGFRMLPAIAATGRDSTHFPFDFMTIQSDRWITRMAREHHMIEPFEGRQVREGVISYGVSSYGYDMRVARE